MEDELLFQLRSQDSDTSEDEERREGQRDGNLTWRHMENNVSLRNLSEVIRVVVWQYTWTGYLPVTQSYPFMSP